MRQLRCRGLSVRLGDGEDPAFRETVPRAETSRAVTTFPLPESNRALVTGFRATGGRGQIAGVVRERAHAEALAGLGVEPVHRALEEAADHAVEILNPQVTGREAEP